MKNAIVIFLLLLAPGIAWAQAPNSPVPNSPAKALDEASYQDCLAQVRVKPEEAFAFAQGWMATGGGLAAGHCAALALFELKQYGDAADRLEKLLPLAEKQAPHLVPELLSQAAESWTLASALTRAKGLLDIAIGLRPNAIDLRVDRAQLLAELEDIKGARSDLDYALSLDPTRTDAYALRAAARRRLGDIAGALEDAETALAIDPRYAEALLERGILRAIKGDKRGARADFIQLRLQSPGSPAAEEAAKQIEAMDSGAN